MLIAHSLLRFFMCAALCLGVGYLSSLATNAEIPTWYAALNKPWWTPPNRAFPAVWTILYALMATSLWLLWDRAPTGNARAAAIGLFLGQLALNAAWSPVFFALHRIDAALVIIVAMALTIAATMAAAWRVHRPAAWLLLPYMVWVTYASTVNAGVYVLNR